MAAATESGGSLGEEEQQTIETSSSVDTSKLDHTNGCDGTSEYDEEVPPPPPVDSSVSTPKESSKETGSGSRVSDESAMDYSPSPTSDHKRGFQSAETSPKQTMSHQPVVSHVPASVKQPVLSSSEQSSVASPAQVKPSQGESDVAAPQQSQQLLERIPTIAVPTLQVIHGTQGQVVTKRKGRFKLLQDSDAPVVGNDALAGGALAPQGAAVAVATVPVVAVVGMEGGLSNTHPSRERSLSNTSTLSAMSTQNQSVATQAVPPSNILTAESPGHIQANVAPIGRKKGRFVVIPGDATDLRQPFPGQQGALSQQNLQTPALVEQLVVTTPQSVVVPMPQPVPLVQDGMHQSQISDSQQYQVAQNVPQHSLQQTNVPQHYSMSSHAQIGCAPQVVQVNFPQHQQQQVGPVATQMRPRSAHSPVPPASQPPQYHQQNAQPPAQMLVTEAPLLPTYVVQTEDGRYHQVIAYSQPMVPNQTGTVSQDASLSQQQALSQSGVQVPMAASSDAVKQSQVAKPAAVKKPPAQRSATMSKGAPANVGFGKVFYFLEQMKLEVTEADRTIKNQGRDMKFLREKNKELEARSRDMERKWLEEKSAREALEAKVKSLKKKIKELKATAEATGGNQGTKVDEKSSRAIDAGEPQSRSDSLDETGSINNEKEDVIVSEREDILGSEQRKVTSKPNKETSERDETNAAERSDSVLISAPGESKESPGVKSTSQPKSSDSITHSKAAAPPKISATTATEGVRTTTSDDFGKQSNSLNLEAPKAAHGISEVTGGTIGEIASPPRPRGSTIGDMTSSISSKKSQAIPVIGGTSGQINATTAVPSSGDSLGSASDFDPLRVGHSMVPGDGQQGPSSASSVLSFVSAPAPAPSVDFDPLSTSHQGRTFSVPEINVHGLYPVSTAMQSASHHGYSQSMPNFVVDPNSMVMAFPAQQVNMNLPSSSGLSNQLQQGWGQPQQQHFPVENQYLPMQYNAVNVAAPLSQPLQEHPGTSAEVSQQQQYSAGLSTPAADPFDELASRRTPGAAGQSAMQHQQLSRQQQQQ